jgi:hypothetical protein
MGQLMPPWRAGATAAGTLLALLQLQQASHGHAFDVAWSGLWPCCGGTTAFNLSAFPVRH